MLSIRKVRLLITSRYIAMQSCECVIISKMFLIYFISYGCNGGALVFLGGAEASASPSFALPMFITIKKIIILHLFLGVPAATVGGTGTPWHTVATPLIWTYTLYLHITKQSRYGYCYHKNTPICRFKILQKAHLMSNNKHFSKMHIWLRIIALRLFRAHVCSSACPL